MFWSASYVLTLNLTESQAFAAPPYSFSNQTMGFLSFATLVRAMIDLLTAGPLSDWVLMCVTRRNNGVREPKMRLPSMIPYVLIMMLGNVVVAFGYSMPGIGRSLGHSASSTVPRASHF